MQAEYETILTEAQGDGLLLVTLNRPEVGNALNTQMGLDLIALWRALLDTPAVRCVVLTGSGGRIFCGGGDLKQRNGMNPAQWQHQHVIFERSRDAQLACPVPIVAAVNGHAFGGGCEIVLACDFAYAASTARFALPEATLGIMPGMGGTQFLPRAVGERRAKEIVLTGRPFTAAEALDWGLLNRVCPPEALLEETLAVARTICANAPLSIRQAKKSIGQGLQMDLHSALLFEVEAYSRLVDTADRREGVLAFNEKRRPVFTGQ